MMPLWLCTLGVVLLRDIFPPYEATVPWRVLLLLGLMFSIPAVIGIVVRRCVSDRTAVVISLVLRALGLVLVISGAAIAFYSNAWMFDYIGDSWRVVVAVSTFRYLLSFTCTELQPHKTGFVVPLILSLKASLGIVQMSATCGHRS